MSPSSRRPPSVSCAAQRGAFGGRPLDRLLLGGILLLSFALNVTAIDWGLPSLGKDTWSYDEIPPSDLGRVALNRHGGRYPPLHYDLLRTLYAPLRWAASRGRLDIDESQLATGLRLAGRSLSVAMAMGTVYLVYRFSRLLLETRRMALLAAFLAALPVPFVRFAKTVNLDVPYTFWFALSLFFLLRLLDRHRWRDHLGFGIVMALAIGTKDQAAGLYLATPALIVATRGGLLRREGARRPYLRAALDPRPLAALAVSLGLLALIHRLPFGLADFRDHLEVMFGKGSTGREDFAATPAGQAAMIAASLRQIAFSLGAPLAVAATTGVAVAVRERRWRMASLLLLPVGYYAAFLAPIQHVRVRWWIPVAMLLAPFAALALARLAAWDRLPRLGRRFAVATVIAYSLALPVCLDLQMLDDSRYRVEAWLRERAAAGESWRAIATHSQLTVRGGTPIPWKRLQRRWPAELARYDLDYLVVNRGDALRSGSARLLADLDAGRVGYVEVLRVHADPCCGRPDWSGVSTVLTTVNPELSVYRRRPGEGPRNGMPERRTPRRRGARNGAPPG
jgi:hypothetical protein